MNAVAMLLLVTLASIAVCHHFAKRRGGEPGVLGRYRGPLRPAGHSFYLSIQEAAMKLFLIFSLMMFLVATQGCSKDSVKRLTYETMQELGQAACRKNHHANCSERESYDDYQRKREEVKRGDDQ